MAPASIKRAMDEVSNANDANDATRGGDFSRTWRYMPGGMRCAKRAAG